MIACVLTGLSVSMLWPGTLIIVGEKYPNSSVSVYALMAVAGDMGGAIIPYLVGIVINNLQLTNNNLFFTGTIEQNSMRGGLLFASVFPVVALIFILILRKYFRKNNISFI